MCVSSINSDCLMLFLGILRYSHGFIFLLTVHVRLKLEKIENNTKRKTRPVTNIKGAQKKTAKPN